MESGLRHTLRRQDRGHKKDSVTCVRQIAGVVKVDKRKEQETQNLSLLGMSRSKEQHVRCG